MDAEAGNATANTTRPNQPNFVELAAEIVSAFVSKHSIRTDELPALIDSVHAALQGVGTSQPAPERERPEPAVNPKRSVQDDYIISLFDGNKYKSLKRHIRTAHGMTPEEYRSYWGLPANYPMVAPSYAKARSELAKQMGLGQKGPAARKAGKGRKRAS
jgi:predicted transcriptional regulator